MTQNRGIKEKVVGIASSAFSIYILACLVFCFLFSYIYLVNKAVRNVSSIQKVDSKMENLLSKVTDLESDYFTAVDSFSVAKAKQLGFVEAERPIFLSKAGPVQQLSLNTNN